MGSYSAVSGAEECDLCPAGTSQNQEGQVECTDCGPASVSDVGAEECTTCPPGTFVENNECTTCPPGSFCPGDGDTHLCDPGFYSAVSGATECVACSEGTFQSSAGATECADCPAGTAQNQTGSISCAPCAVGTYSAVDGAVECDLCPSGTFQDQVGQTECLACDPLVNNVTQGIPYCALQTAIDEANEDDLITTGTGTLDESADASLSGVQLSAGNSPGCMTLTGNLILDTTNTFLTEIDGNTACTEFDQVQVDGTATLGNATLEVQLGYAPIDGEEFEIITSNNAIIGTFAEGSCIVASFGGNDYYFSISYSSNAVTLTAGDGPIAININTGNAYCSIQAAIDDAATVSGHTIELTAGTYNESVYVHKSNLTILGPNVGLAGDDGARTAEAVVEPTAWYGIYTDADEVTIDGITLDGQNICDYGIYAAIDNTGFGEHTIQNNVVKNINIMGFVGYVPSGAPSSENLVTRNLFHDIDGRAVVALWNYYANVIDNVIHSTPVGIYAENANQPESTGTVEWKDNTISASRSGIWYNLAYGTATPLTIEDNVIDVEDDPSGTRWDGMWLTSLGGDLDPVIVNNNITGASVTQQTNGYHLWNNSTTATNGITINGGSVSEVGYGVWINNWDGYPTTGSNANSTTALIKNVNISDASTAGIYIKDNDLNTNGAAGFVHAMVENNVISNAGTAILVEGDDATAQANFNSFTGYTSGAIENDAPTLMDATCNWYGQTAGPLAADITGDVTYSPWLLTDNLTTPDCGGGEVHNLTQGLFYNTIQLAVDDASPNDVLQIESADFTEPGQVVVDKNLTLQGLGMNATTLRPGINTGTSGNARGFILVNSGVNFALQDLTVDGTGKLVWQAVRNLGEGSIENVVFTQIKYNPSTNYQGTGVAAFGTGNVDVSNCEFEEIGRIGVIYFGTGINGASFTENTYIGKGPGDWLDYALDISAGAKVNATGNTISGNRGVADSDGSTSAGVLVSTYFGPGTEATITNNFISDNSTGVFVGFNASDASTATVNDNSITGNDNGVVSTASPVDATCNWWGTAVYDDIALLMSGPVTFNPALLGGADASPAAGFQPGDACDNTDLLPPVTVCEDITLFLDASGVAFINSPEDLDGGSTDNDSIASFAIDMTNFDCSHLGPNNVTLTVTDVNGNSDTCVAVVTVVDNIAPTISCGAGGSRIIDQPNATYEVSGTEFDPVSVDDNCDFTVTHDASAITGAVAGSTAGSLAGWQLPEGVHEITFTIEDAAENTATCSVTITVEPVEMYGSVVINQNCAPIDVRVRVYEQGSSSLVASFVTSVSGSGAITLPLSGVGTGNYDVFLKVEGYLQKGLYNETISGSSISVSISNLSPGDISGGSGNFNDNAINGLDLSLMVQHYNTLSGDPNYNARCDLDCNGQIGGLDLSLMSFFLLTTGDNPTP